VKAADPLKVATAQIKTTLLQPFSLWILLFPGMVPDLESAAALLPKQRRSFMLLHFPRLKTLSGVCFTLLAAVSLAAQVAVDLVDGPVNVATIGSLPMGSGLAQVVSPGNGPASTLAFYAANYPAFGTPVPFNIVGTDPSLGAATTTVPAFIVPLKIVFASAGGLFLDGTNPALTTSNSPMFQTADYTTGGVDLGVTQYGDAMQRGQFWNLPGFSRVGYHVLLGTPVIAPTVTVTVPVGKGNRYRLRSGGLLGVVDDTYFNTVLATLYPSYSPNQLPIFLTDNVFLGANGVIQNCCTLGFHASQGPPASSARTWIYSGYAEPGTFVGDAILDVQILSHEVSEWLDDPFVGAFAFGFLNFIPPAVLPGQGGNCIINFETGDPLEAPPISFTKVTNGTTYHLQDEVFLPWYLHTSPSFSVNGMYTYLGTFPGPSALCGPG